MNRNQRQTVGYKHWQVRTPKAALKMICFFNTHISPFPLAIDWAAQKQFSWLLIRPNRYESNVVIQVN